MEEKPIFISATDGNHGYSLAYAAKILGCQAIIFMPVVSIGLLKQNKNKKNNNLIQVQPPTPDLPTLNIY